jgi:hypothetical protein
MRSSVDLVDRPYAFSQLRPLLLNGFAGEARKRGFSHGDQTFEALHRFRILSPLFRVKRDGRTIANLARTDPSLARQVAYWQPTSAEDLVDARNAGRLFDPALEPITAYRRLMRPLNDHTYLSSVYLYSEFQLVFLPLLRQAVGFLRWSKRADAFIPT